MKKSKFFFFFVFLIVIFKLQLPAEVVKSYDQGILEKIEGQQVLHLKGSSYQMGFQHGKLLKEQIIHNIRRFIDSRISSSRAPTVVQNFLAVLPQVIPHIPKELIDEMHGIADGADVSYDKVLLLNLFPEMFHCSAIAVANKASLDGILYQARVLDYVAGTSLQDTAVLFVVKPENGHAFVNVSYAGFIGSVTGMNEEKIALGEIGGQGYGQWDGMPMAFLLREILQYAGTLEEVKEWLSNTPRTCAYYYLFSDGKTRDSFAAYVTPEILTYVTPGMSYDLPISHKPYDAPSEPYVRHQPEDCIVLTKEYSVLIERLLQNYGHITYEDLKAAIRQPVSNIDNLHNAIFAPETLEFWVSHAGPHNEPACDQPYHHFSLRKLLAEQGPSP